MRHWLLLTILLIGAFLRLQHTRDVKAEYIERYEFIPAAMTISSDHLPIRVAQHAALPAYAIRASGMIFGESLVGWRMASVLAGTATILLLYLIGARWWGPGPGLIAAGFLAVERYHAVISARAIDLPFDLFFIALALYAFSRYVYTLDRSRDGQWESGWLYLTAVACGLGFLCKELTALVLPALLLSLPLLDPRAWYRRREVWGAVFVFLLIISPDLLSNLTVTPAERIELLKRHQEAATRLGIDLPDGVYDQTGLYMSYGDQLSKFRSMGFNAEPFYFYFGGLLDALGVPHRNRFGEFPYMHPAMGILLWVGVAYPFFQRPKDRPSIMLLTMYVVLFVPFTLVQLGAPRAQFPTDSAVLWYWVDRTMFPAMLLTGQALWRLKGRRRPAATAYAKA